jgi:proteasome assembly chaperone 2
MPVFPIDPIQKKIFFHSCRENVPLVTLLVFCAEGNNIPDATILLHFTNVWLQMKTNKVFGGFIDI